MNIKITEYVGASTIALNIKNVPMTALPGIKEAFVQLCTTVDMQQEPRDTSGFTTLEEAIADGVFDSQVVVCDKETQEAAREFLDAIDAVAVKPAVKRGRPRKIEAVEDKEPVGETAESESLDTPTSPEPTPSEIVNSASAASTNSLSENTASTDASSMSETPASAKLSDITDSELQKYCAKLAAHFGDPKKVFDLAQPFVPEGAVARPTNIKDNARRHAFIQAAEAASGVRYHG